MIEPVAGAGDEIRSDEDALGPVELPPHMELTNAAETTAMRHSRFMPPAYPKWNSRYDDRPTGAVAGLIYDLVKNKR